MVVLLGRLPTTPPPQTTFRDDKPSLLVCWWCTLYALVFIGFRIIGRYIRTKRIFLDDKIMILAILPLLARMCIETSIIVHGTNNVDTMNLTQAQIHSREWGSKLVIISRILYPVYLWIIKYSISIFLRTLTAPIWTRLHQAHLGYLHLFLFITFLIVILATLAPCQPFNHFWQVVPDPGSICRQNYIQMFTVGSLNVLTNLVLVIFPIPMVLMSGLPLKQKINILLRLSLPLFPIVLTLYAIPSLSSRDPSSGSHIRRSLLVSIDMLLTAFSANAVVLFSLLQDKGYKKSKFRHMQESFNTFRPAVVTHPSFRSGSIENTMVELYDAVSLVPGVTSSGGADSDNNNGNKRRKSKVGHENTSLGEIKNDLESGKMTNPTSLSQGIEREKMKSTQPKTYPEERQQELADDDSGQFMNVSKRESQYSKENDCRGDSSKSFCKAENGILHPPPAHLGNIRLETEREVHFEIWAS